MTPVALATLALLQAADVPETGSSAGRITSSPAAWAIAAVLMVTAAYFLIRLLEWDLVNKETPDQDDPLS